MAEGGALQDRVAIVTGAGQGVGLAIARRFGHEGARVIIAELVEERGRVAAQALVGEGLDVVARSLDVRDPVSIGALVDELLARYGRIDILVNNAGLSVLGRSEELALPDWQIQIDVMLTGVFLMAQRVARPMIAAGSGVIVNIASIGGMGGWPMRSGYNAAKAGVINLTSVLATEWAQHGIRVNAVSPGVTRTEMVDQAVRDGFVSLEAYERRIPAGRLASADDIAGAVLFLASDRSSFVTGTNLRVDGGWVPWGNLNAVGFPEGGKMAE